MLTRLASPLAAVGLALALGCAAPPPQPVSTAVAAPQTAPIQPTVAVRLPPPTPPPPPTTTPVPRPPLRIGVALVPPQPEAGAEFTLRLTVSNAGERIAHGVYIATTGPWEQYTVLSVEPSGRVGRDANGWHIVTPLDVQPGSDVVLQVHVRAENPSDERLTFAVREADPGEL